MANRNFEVSFTGWVATAPNTYKYDSENPSKCLCAFTAIHTPRYKSNSGEWKEKESMRIQIKCWGWQALYISDSIRVGDPIVAIGRLERTKWLDANGEENFGMELTASTVGHDLSFGKSRFFRMQGLVPREPDLYQRVFSLIDTGIGTGGLKSERPGREESSSVETTVDFDKLVLTAGGKTTRSKKAS